MTSTIVHDHAPTGELPAIDDQDTPTAEIERPRGGWIIDDRQPGRHRSGRAGLQHVSAIAGVDLRPRPRPRRRRAAAEVAPPLFGGGAS